MSDAPSGFKSPHVQVEQQRSHYENTTHLRIDLRSWLEPAPTGIAKTVYLCRGLFSVDGLKRSPRASALSNAPSIVALGRRVCRDKTSMQYAQANQQHESGRIAKDRDSRGTTPETDEEEKELKSVPRIVSERPSSPSRHTGRRWRQVEQDAVRSGAFITTTYWYHSGTIPSPFPTGSGDGGTTVVPLLSSRGVGA